LCGRYTLSTSGEDLAAQFEVSELAHWSPRFNIAPSQSVPILIRSGAETQVKLMHWGLVPGWAKDKKLSSRMINARAETVSEKPAFRAAYRKRRCLVLADGYYEWVKQDGGKRPYYMRLESGHAFAFAGLWETWESDDDSAYLSYSIITCASNQQLAPLHHRMPVIVEASEYDNWLDDKASSGAIAELLKPSANGILATIPVSTFVNSPAHEGPDCVIERQNES
jgi:putative SOS response-associated peptidase YedK